MELKRYYKRPDGWKPRYNEYDANGDLIDRSRPVGALLNPLPETTPIDFVELIHTGVHREQNFSPRFVNRALREGWLSLRDGKIVLHCKYFPRGFSKHRHERDAERMPIEFEDVNLEYTIVYVPGVYCLHCGDWLGEDPSGEVGRLHVRTDHRGMKSPDERYPHGYRNGNLYECILDAGQHERFRKSLVSSSTTPDEGGSLVDEM